MDAGRAARRGGYDPATYLENRFTAVCVAGDGSPPEMAAHAARQALARAGADPARIGMVRQPLLAPVARGIITFLAKAIEGVMHVLVHARVEPGFIDIVELGPTLQLIQENYAGLPQPCYLDYVLGADPARIRFDAFLSEEGGRFFDAQNRYLVIEVEDDFPVRCPQDYRWVTLGQLSELLGHGHYLNVQARSLVACLHSLW